MKSKNLQYGLVLIFLVIVATIFYFSNSQSKNVNSEFTEKTNPQSAPIVLAHVLIADTDATRELGLGKRDSLPSDTGMLFIFDHPDTYGFWMKDMQFPIDIIWIDDSMRIVSIAHDVSPATYPKIISPTAKASYVLEVNAGIAEKNNYKEGNILTFLRDFIATK